MELKIKENGNSALIKVIGKVTATHLHDSLRGAVKDLYASGKKEVILDMEEVIHIDSTGVGELVSAYTSAAKEKTTLFLFNVPETVLELLEITNLLDVFTILEPGSEQMKKFK
jgi:anti-sigma B factor antagonist